MNKRLKCGAFEEERLYVILIGSYIVKRYNGDTHGDTIVEVSTSFFDRHPQSW